MNEFLLSLLPRFYLLVALVILDVLGGAVTSWRRGNFSFEELPEFLRTLLPYLYAWITAEVLGFLPEFLGIDSSGPLAELFSEGLGVTTYLFVAGKYLASIMTHLQSLRGERASG